MNPEKYQEIKDHLECLYLIYWQDKIKPEFDGLLTANGEIIKIKDLKRNSSVAIFSNINEVINTMKRYKERQMLKVIKFSLNEVFELDSLLED